MPRKGNASDKAIRQLLRHAPSLQDVDSLEDLYMDFQLKDRSSRGYISRTKFIEKLCDLLSPEDQANCDLETLVAVFGHQDRSDAIDYAAFCHALEQSITNVSEKQRPRPARDLKSPKGRKQFRLQVQSPTSPHARTNKRPSSEEANASESDVTKRQIRVDKRLETQRMLTQSIRKKLQRGIMGAALDGFPGVQEALMTLDCGGDGYLDERVFVNEVMSQLAAPLTKKEMAFLLANIRVRESASTAPVVDFEQLGSFCNLETDESDSGQDDSYFFAGQGFPAPSSPTKTAHLGADFLAAEKQLESFLQGEIASADGNEETPRSAYTGAERFIEFVEKIDIGKTGFIKENGISLVLAIIIYKTSFTN